MQGVGFRPFIFHLAQRHQLSGSVHNDGQGVVIEVEGAVADLQRFERELVTASPPLASIEEMHREIGPAQGHQGFVIKESLGQGSGKAPLPPDLASCPACLEEVINPSDRHYQYPFTNCTHCGPRFTILQELPYDRQHTALQSFPLCAACAKEYHDPGDRRFHAQPVACPQCGPQVALVDGQGHPVEGDWLAQAADFIKQGNILAIKGLGGFHLACDAQNSGAIRELRRRKQRPQKPLAVMARNLAVIERFCHLTPEEAQLLQSPAAPIVLLQQRGSPALPRALAPGLSCLGMLLPYTPLHHLLLQQGPELLVMTSGNRSGLPLVVDNQCALEELQGIADYFLWHNRDILHRCDDSLAQVVGGQINLLRRSRGWVPQPLTVATPASAPTTLALGGEMKNTFCLLHQGKAYLSQHMGEVAHREGLENLGESILEWCSLLGVKPQLVTADLHPQYQSARLANDLAKKWGAQRHPGVQHHHAHLVSCLAEHGVTGPVLGVILDGTGYGLDGKLWGFELLRGDAKKFRREIFLQYGPLIGGEQAIRQPWLCAAGYLLYFLGAQGAKAVEKLFPERSQELRIVQRVLGSGSQFPLASSCGRLFDTVAAILGLCGTNTYEGEAAILLGNEAPWFPSGPVTGQGPFELQPYPFELQGQAIDPTALLSSVVAERQSGVPTAVIAKRFHDTIIAILLAAVVKIRERTGLNQVALSGGTWQNRYLFGMTKHHLEDAGFMVLHHQKTPTNDGALALGQTIIAAVQSNH